MKTVYFAHGQESGPWGSKIAAMAEVAQRLGWQVHSPDYRDIADPDERVAKLLALQPQGQPLVLVGSSLGGYVATVASRSLEVAGLFLLAPAFYMPIGKEQNPRPQAGRVRVVHGWEDEVVPVEHAIRFARQYGAELELLPDSHRLLAVLPQILDSFEQFLRCRGN